MRREYNFECIGGIRGGVVLYEDNGKIVKIDIKESAEYWWEIHHKQTIIDRLSKKKYKNKYAGDKCFNFVESYIRLYTEEDEIIFKKKFPQELDTSDACEFRMYWDRINQDINKSGYWLFDEG